MTTMICPHSPTPPRKTVQVVDKDDPKDLTTMTEESMEGAEETTRLRERLGWQRRRCVELITAALALKEEDRPEDSATTT